MLLKKESKFRREEARPSSEQPRRAYKLLVDGMLGTLATKLRILGFDALYDKVSDDSELLSLAKKSKRYLVTSDMELFLQARRMHSNSVLISSRDELGRLVELCSKLALKTILIPDYSRCSTCNGELEKTQQRTREGKPIYTCKDCKKKYWRGAHWRKLDLFFSAANAKLKSMNSTNKERSSLRKEGDAHS